MTRKTKAEKDAEAQAARDAYLESQRQAYPTRLMAALQAATSQPEFDLTVRDGVFVLRNRNQYDTRSEYTNLALTWDEDSQYELEELEMALDRAARERDEAKRKAELRANAQRKAQELFSAEEREALGL
jgi:hypothetical protein